ncbi:MAG: PepSY-like domain-containing protein, partial [Tannerella sp.]|nr:PepSY-like domain-containing protein [Tannerella sp.]
MKKYIFSMALLGAAFAFVACDDDVLIGENELPSEAKAFIATHFPSARFVWGEKDRGGYEVRLDDGFELDFSLDGTWDNVDGNHMKEVPASVMALVPERISAYIAENYQGAAVTKIDKEHNRRGKHTGYEITLNNYYSELIFGPEGNF